VVVPAGRPAPRRAFRQPLVPWRPRGALAEWLGTGLQNLVHRFDSGRRLEGKDPETGLSYYLSVVRLGTRFWLRSTFAPVPAVRLSGQTKSARAAETAEPRATGGSPHSGGKCTAGTKGMKDRCKPSYAAWVFDKRTNGKRWQTFPPLAAARNWRKDANAVLRAAGGYWSTTGATPLEPLH
jgi:hypothetical protein